MADLISMLAAAAGTSTGGINPREYFNTVLYTGNGTTQSITGVGFQPDLVWCKSRSNAYWHSWVDAVRGRAYTLFSNTTNAEFTSPSDKELTAFTSDGFSLGPDFNYSINSSGATFVAWNWKANGAGVSNTDGTITSTVSANTTAGISIITYAGNGIGGATVGHGLGAVPKMFILKERNGSSAGDFWATYHVSLGNTKYLTLNTTNAEETSAYWNNTTPSSSVITLGSNTNINDSGGPIYLIYAFAEVEGFSKFGSYTGNGSATGPSVTTDFEPTWLMIKRTDTTGDWIILDSARDATNPRTEFLEPNTSDAEATGNDVDFNATGFQLKSTSASINASGGTYIYACFA